MSLRYGLLKTSKAIFLHPYSLIESSESTFSLCISISLLIERKYMYDKTIQNQKTDPKQNKLNWEIKETKGS